MKRTLLITAAVAVVAALVGLITLSSNGAFAARSNEAAAEQAAREPSGAASASPGAGQGPASPAAPEPAQGPDPAAPTQQAQSFRELAEAAPDVSPEIVRQTACGLQSSTFTGMLGPDFTDDWDLLRDVILTAEDLGRTYGQLGDTDRVVYEGVKLVEQTTIAWRTAVSYAEVGKTDEAKEAMATAAGYLEQLDRLNATALCPK